MVLSPHVASRSVVRGNVKPTIRLEPGTIIGGDFELVSLIGEGGMGAVYEAHQTSTGATRAVKTMRAELAEDPSFRERFAKEAQVTARVESDHVVQVLSAGIDEALGIPWIAMELVRGEDLGHYIRRHGKLPPAIAVDVFAQLGHALAAAHAAGIVHRDLKPDNILVAAAKSATQRFTVKVLDFGIAKVLSAAQATTTGAMGTPLWMAPEQASKGSQIAPGTDVWALGLIAFYALTGRSYWLAANDPEGTAVQMFKEITLDPLEPASSRGAALGGAALPPGFDAWFARCVGREVSSRFKDAAESTPPLLALLRAAATLAPSSEPTEVIDADLPYASTKFIPEIQESTRPAGRVTTGGRGVISPRASTNLAFAEPPGNTGEVAAPRPAHRRLYAIPVVLLGVAGALAFVYRGSLHGPAAVASASAPRLRVPTVLVQGGLYKMGSTTGADDETPPTEVSVSGVEVDVTETTAAAYAACVAAGGCTPTAHRSGCTGDDPEKQNHPINCITYKQAAAYCEWMGKRLPSETEWERVARGDTGRPYPWGTEPPKDQACWNRGKLGTCEVGGFPASNTPEGVADIAGGVWEWTTSNYCPYAQPACTDTRRVLRGGSWDNVDPKLLTTTVRMESLEGDQSPTVGVRCVRRM